MKLPHDARIGRVALAVRDHDRMRAFYEDTLGLPSGRVELLHAPDARPRPRGSAGLYHLAILVPTRADLAGAVRRLLEKRWPIEGASDHLVSEAIYLSDPEGNGIEVYADRPRESWPWHGDVLGMATEPLDAEDLLAQRATPHERLPDATRVGHVHLQVGDVPSAEAFYRDVVGMDLTARYGAQASFLSAGRYHHHVAVNSWQSRGAPPAPRDALGLRWFEVEVPGLAEPRELTDPAGNVVRLVAPA